MTGNYWDFYYNTEIYFCKGRTFNKTLTSVALSLAITHGHQKFEDYHQSSVPLCQVLLY